MLNAAEPKIRTASSLGLDGALTSRPLPPLCETEACARIVRCGAPLPPSHHDLRGLLLHARRAGALRRPGDVPGMRSSAAAAEAGGVGPRVVVGAGAGGDREPVALPDCCGHPASRVFRDGERPGDGLRRRVSGRCGVAAGGGCVGIDRAGAAPFALASAPGRVSRMDRSLFTDFVRNADLSPYTPSPSPAHPNLNRTNPRTKEFWLNFPKRGRFLVRIALLDIERTLYP